MNKLQHIRQQKGLTREALAERLGVTATTIYRKEQGLRGLKTSEIDRYAEALECLPGDLLELKSTTSQTQTIPLVGFVGAGAAVDLVDAYELGGGHDELDCPPDMNPAKTVAVQVRGDSMEPFISDGWYLYYEKRIYGVPSEFLGKLCVVKLADADTVLVKRIVAGDSVGHHHLLSYNDATSPPLKNQTIEWSARVAFIKPA